MKILIIGGTKFFGRHLIDATLDNGHEVTIFHRGNHQLENAENIEEIFGDRYSDLEKLNGKSWDAVIDTCGYLPQMVELSAEFLKESVGKYVFISSVSAYGDFSKIGFDENTKLAELTAEQEKEFAEIDPKGELNGMILGEMYGALKVLCEEAVHKHFGENALIIRPGLIVGKYDFTDRWTYWVMRVAKGGKVLAPGNPESFVQFIDAEDLAKWTMYMVENNESGIYNATGKPQVMTFGEMLGEIKDATTSNAEFVWVDEEFLSNENVAPWSDMPLYLPASDLEIKGFLTANVDKAIKKGLKFRPLQETITETYNWRKTLEKDLQAGISVERETELLQKWQKPNSA